MLRVVDGAKIREKKCFDNSNYALQSYWSHCVKELFFAEELKELYFAIFFLVLIHLSSFLFDIYFYMQKILFYCGIFTHQFELISLLLLPFLVEFNLPTFLNDMQ